MYKKREDLFSELKHEYRSDHMDWIIAANPNKYDVFAAFEEYDYIDWTQSANFEVGDSIYLYISKPYQQIMYATEVIAVNLTENEIAEDNKYWVNPMEAHSKKRKKYVRLKKSMFIDYERLTLEHLMNHGLSKAPQGPVRVPQQLLEYIEAQFSSDYSTPGEIAIEDVTAFVEGATTSIYINKYERSRTARNQCIAHFGPHCTVCEMDFEEVYGDVGKDFIHVHHIVPLNEIKAAYTVNPITDLIPVCPNCHAMLHRKVNGETLTIEQLKNRLSINKF